MAKMTTEEAFVKVLQMHSIEHAFGIIGSAFMPISDLFPKAGITFWDVAHESNGGLICDGYTRSTGKIAMCIAQNGPGITGFVTPIKTAYWNHTPMLLVTPQAANKTIGQGGFQEVEQMNLFKDMVCYQEEVKDPSRMAEVLNRVIEKAIRGSAPAQINVPRDFWTQVIDIELPAIIRMERPSGEKYRHIKLAENNAKENIKLKKASLENHHQALHNLKKFLKLDELPNRIEVYDNSHTFGNDSVGVMIVVDQEGLSPKNYRKYNIRYNTTSDDHSPIDDYYMMKEVLSRRIKKINKTEDAVIPDVMIVDGGRGQFNVVEGILKENNLETISLMSVSKGKKRNSGREIIHTPDKNINLRTNDPLLFFIQRIRDEAHRFAITAHRSRRGKKSVRSIFDDLPGIGPKRKKSLLLKFGSIENIKKATLEDLKSTKNVPDVIVNQIYDFFHSQ